MLSTHSVYLCALYGFQNKEELFPYAILSVFITNMEVFTTQYELNV
jgi:hypothetical protein